MLFEKKDEKAEKIRIDDPRSPSKYSWVTLRKGNQIELSEYRGKQLGLVPVKEEAKKLPEPVEEKEHKKPDKNPEVKKKEKGIYKENLESIKGIGAKTAKDIIQVYPTEAILVKALNQGSDIPIRDDLAKLLKKKFKVR